MLQSRYITKHKAITSSAFMAVLLGYCSSVTAEDYRWNIGIETGAVWQNRNDVQIPGDTGTRFSLTELVGKGPFGFLRLEMFYDMKPRHQLRFLIAPFRYTESGVFGNNVFFVDQTFAAGQATNATYQFNSYRVTYRYLFYQGSRWDWWIGATAKIRDAEIALQQGTVAARDTNVGLVPLLNLYGDYKLTDKWRFIVDFDGLIGPQGRALDLGLKIQYDITKQWYVGGGIRTLEGGADNDEVYNFGWFNYAVVSAGYQF
jgi:hypothetical protein